MAPSGGRVCVLTFVIINVTVSLVSYTFLHYIKVYKVSFIIAGLFLIADGGPLILFIDSTSSTGAIYGCMVFVAEDIGAGLRTQNLSQIGSQVYALVVSGQIYQSEVIQNILVALADSGIPQEVMESAKASTQSTIFQTLDGELQERAIQAVIETVKTTYVLVLVCWRGYDVDRRFVYEVGEAVWKACRIAA